MAKVGFLLIFGTAVGMTAATTLLIWRNNAAPLANVVAATPSAPPNVAPKVYLPIGAETIAEMYARVQAEQAVFDQSKGYLAILWVVLVLLVPFGAGFFVNTQIADVREQLRKDFAKQVDDGIKKANESLSEATGKVNQALADFEKERDRIVSTVEHRLQNERSSSRYSIAYLHWYLGESGWAVDQGLQALEALEFAIAAVESLAKKGLPCPLRRRLSATLSSNFGAMLRAISPIMPPAPSIQRGSGARPYRPEERSQVARALVDSRIASSDPARRQFSVCRN